MVQASKAVAMLDDGRLRDLDVSWRCSLRVLAGSIKRPTAGRARSLR